MNIRTPAVISFLLVIELIIIFLTSTKKRNSFHLESVDNQRTADSLTVAPTTTKKHLEDNNFHHFYKIENQLKQIIKEKSSYLLNVKLTRQEAFSQKNKVTTVKAAKELAKKDNNRNQYPSEVFPTLSKKAKAFIDLFYNQGFLKADLLGFKPLITCTLGLAFKLESNNYFDKSTEKDGILEIISINDGLINVKDLDDTPPHESQFQKAYIYSKISFPLKYWDSKITDESVKELGSKGQIDIESSLIIPQSQTPITQKLVTQLKDNSDSIRKAFDEWVGANNLTHEDTKPINTLGC